MVTESVDRCVTLSCLLADDSNGLDFSKPSENLMEQKRTCASHEAPPITDSVVRTCSSEPYSWLVGYFQSNS